jgi:hypothetical protein
MEYTQFDSTQLAGIIASQWQQQSYVPSVTVPPEQQIAGRILRGVPQVEVVFVDRSAEVTRVWTIVDVDDEVVSDAIYAEERKLIRDFHDRFDFHVLAREGRSLSTLMTFRCGGWVRKQS